jgi:hypothetical protein
MAVTFFGIDLFPYQSRALALSWTPDALTHLRAAGASPSVPNTWSAFVDRGLRAIGFKNGKADLPGMVIKYLFQ